MSDFIGICLLENIFILWSIIQFDERHLALVEEYICRVERNDMNSVKEFNLISNEIWPDDW